MLHNYLWITASITSCIICEITGFNRRLDAKKENINSFCSRKTVIVASSRCQLLLRVMSATITWDVSYHYEWGQQLLPEMSAIITSDVSNYYLGRQLSLRVMSATITGDVSYHYECCQQLWHEMSATISCDVSNSYYYMRCQGILSAVSATITWDIREYNLRNQQPWDLTSGVSS